MRNVLFIWAVILLGFGTDLWFEAGEVSAQPRLIVVLPDKHDVSPPLRNIPPQALPRASVTQEMPLFRLPPGPRQKPPEAEIELADPVTQDWHGSPLLPAPTRNFEGISNADNDDVVGRQPVPPDTNGDVGPDHYVQMVNIIFAIFDRNGNLLLGPAATNTLWSGFGGPCETTNNGDPIVLYDHLAGRWMLSQFALPSLPDGPFFQCIAVSQTGDPTGAYYRYAFQMPVDKLNDYPKFGVWPDAYYMSVNQFTAGSLVFAGAGVAAFERSKMLSGLAAQMIYIDLESVDPGFGGLLPADLDGPPPSPGTPNFFVAFTQTPADELQLWEFRVNFSNPAGSTFGLSGLPNTTLATVPFNSFFGLRCLLTHECLPQPSTRQRLDALTDRLMFRLQYRNFGTHQTLVTNHTVNAGISFFGRAGVRWYELRNSGGGWSIHQQGTYAPDNNHRWMGSIAMDSAGNIALGFSVSSTQTFPSIRLVGRLANDPLGALPQGETELIAGGGSQTGLNRWGDYSMMAVDPTDDCTFWYTQEYYEISSARGWQTRIGAFKFPSCGSP
jgi:hypothetical protein